MKERKNSDQSIVEQLLMQAREGNQLAFAELFKMYEPLFYSLLHEAGALQPQDAEDLRQELSIAFVNSIHSYDLEQSEVKFGLFAKICMQNARTTQLRKLQKRTAPLPYDEEAELAFNEGSGGEIPSEEVVNLETLQTMNKKIQEALSPFEWKVWQMYMAELGTKNISKELEKSEKSIENAIFRIKRKLRGLFENKS
jgi:RNA polymerase sporulation-specific sigma factor